MTSVGSSRNATTPGHAQRASTAETSPSSKNEQPADPRAERSTDQPSSERSGRPKSSHSQPINPGLQKALQTKRILRQQIAERQAGGAGESGGGRSGEVHLDLEGGRVEHDGDAFYDPAGDEPSSRPQNEGREGAVGSRRAAGPVAEGCVFSSEAPEAFDDYHVNPHYAGEIPRRQQISQHVHAGLNCTQGEADRTINAEQQTMYRDAGRTARNQGTAAYARSFGAWGLATRGAGVATSTLTKNPFVNGAVNTLAPLVMTATHGAAGAASKPGDEGTKFISTPETQLPPNAAGNAFRPFMGGLGVGNTVVSGVVDGGTAVAVASGAGAPTSAGSSAIQGTIKNALFFIPGMASGIHTARNLYATQAQAGMSLQQPARDLAGRQVGVVVTHQTAIPQEGGRQEIGQVKIDDGQHRLRLSIGRGDGGQADIRRLPDEGIEPPPTQSQRASTYAAGINPYPKEGNAETGEEKRHVRVSSETMTKTAALASTLAASAAVSTYVTPAVKSGLEARGVDPSVAEPVSTIVTTAASSMLLSLDFIPKFMTFGQPTRPAGAPPADQRTWRQFFDNTAAGKVLQASIPGFGGMVALARGRADVTAAPRLDQAQFTGLAENKADMLASLQQHSQATAGVVRSNDGTLRIDAGAARGYIQGLPVYAPQQNPA